MPEGINVHAGIFQYGMVAPAASGYRFGFPLILTPTSNANGGEKSPPSHAYPRWIGCPFSSRARQLESATPSFLPRLGRTR
jgi:hypothetical protein